MPVRYVFFLLFFLVNTSVYAVCQPPNSVYVDNITHQSVRLNWYYYNNGNESPSFQVQWRTAGAASWNNSVVTANTTSLTNLTNNTIYEWRVRTICTVGDTSVYTNGAPFQITCNEPGDPNVANVTHQSAQLVWYSSATNAVYEVQWRSAGATIWNVVNNLTTGSLNLSGLAEETSFEWKVRTICSSTASSDFVTGPFFRTRCLPPTNPRTTLANPDAAELKWDAPSASTRFDIQWRAAGTSVWNLVEGITSAEHILTGLTNSTTYEWQVRSACSVSSKSAWLDVQLFQTSCPMPTDVVTSSVGYNSAVLQWNTFAAELQWRAGGTGNWNSVPNAKSPYSLTGLTTNTVYEWQVRTTCSPMSSSEFTPVQLATTRCQTPNSLYAYSSSSGSLDVQWYGGEGGSFELQWRVTGSGSWSSVTGITDPFYSLKNVQIGTRYEWRVRRVCSPTASSDFAIGEPVTIVCSYPTNLSTRNLTTSSVELFWDTNDREGTYELQWRKVYTPTWTTVSNLTDNRYTVTNLQEATSYDWRVRKSCSGNQLSEYASSYIITPQCQLPSSLNTLTIEASSATLYWTGNYGLTYEIQYRPVNTSAWTSVTSLTTTTYSLTGLSANTTYEWRVRTECAQTFSDIQTFTAQCKKVDYLNVSLLNFNTVRLTWGYDTKTVDIQYRETGVLDWTSIETEGTQIIGSGDDVSQKSYVLYNLPAGKTYEWRVRVKCFQSVYSDFVNGMAFSTGCLTPTGIWSYSSSSTSLNIVWNSPIVPTTYELQWRAVGATNWNTVSNITSASYRLTGLTLGANYEYRLRQLCSPNVASEYSTSAQATITCNVINLTTTELVSNGVARLLWRYNAEYIDETLRSADVQYRIEGTSTWTTVSGITGRQYSLTSITPNVTYEWRVRERCSATVFADFSTISTFKWNCTPPFPDNYNTKAGVNSANLFWNTSIERNSDYSVQWRLAGTSEWSSVTVPSGVTQYYLTGLANNTTYEWRVGTACSGGFQPEFSTIQSFRTACNYVEYIFISSVSYSRATLGWTGISLASGESYTVQYRIKGQIIWSEITGITSTTALLSGLVGNTTYECRIKTRCGAGGSVGFSPINMFTTTCPSIYNLSLSIKTESALLSWSSNPDILSVIIRFRKYTPDGAWSTTTINGNSTPAYLFAGLQPGTRYQYQLDVVCASGVSTKMGLQEFYTSGVSTNTPVAIYVDNLSISSQSAQLYWVGGEDQISYVLQWRPRNGTWITTGPLSSKRYLLNGLIPNTEYEVQLSYSDHADVSHVATTSFKTICPAAFSLNTSSITSTSARLNWSVYNLPVTVQWRAGGTTTWQSITGITGNTYLLTGLTDNTIYEWRILTQCSVTASVGLFRTGCQMPTIPVTRNIATTSAKLSWEGAGETYSVHYRIVGTTAWTTLSGLTSTTCLITGLTDNAIYEWAVATVCEPNTSTIFTSPLRFKTQCYAPDNQRVALWNTGPVTFYWDGAEPAYLLEWRSVGSTAWNQAQTVTSPYTLTGLTTGTKYEWRVSSTCGAVSNEPFIFMPRCTDEIANKFTQNVTPGSAQLNWDFNPSATYNLRWRKLGDINWMNVAGKVTSPYTLTGLTNATQYEWQVLSGCQSVYSSSDFFQTHCYSPAQLWTEDITTTSVRFRWNNSGDGLGYELRWREVGTSDWNVISGITENSFWLACLTNATTYEWQVRSRCGNEDYPITASFKTINDCLSGIYSVRDGFWNDPTVWSCNRVPMAEDVVNINHVLFVPSNYVARGITIHYGVQAKLIMSIGATIKLGP